MGNQSRVGYIIDKWRIIDIVVSHNVGKEIFVSKKYGKKIKSIIFYAGQKNDARGVDKLMIFCAPN